MRNPLVDRWNKNLIVVALMALFNAFKKLFKRYFMNL